eukprot:scaffold1129_cov376-Prasinococcus_capsulatus_cf.AAC.13
MGTPPGITRDRFSARVSPALTNPGPSPPARLPTPWHANLPPLVSPFRAAPRPSTSLGCWDPNGCAERPAAQTDRCCTTTTTTTPLLPTATTTLQRRRRHRRALTGRRAPRRSGLRSPAYREEEEEEEGGGGGCRNRHCGLDAEPRCSSWARRVPAHEPSAGRVGRALPVLRLRSRAQRADRDAGRFAIGALTPTRGAEARASICRRRRLALALRSQIRPAASRRRSPALLVLSTTVTAAAAATSRQVTPPDGAHALPLKRRDNELRLGCGGRNWTVPPVLGALPKCVLGRTREPTWVAYLGASWSLSRHGKACDRAHLVKARERGAQLLYKRGTAVPPGSAM